MKLSEYKNEDALELIADILEPTAKIFSDKALVNLIQGGGTRIDAIKRALKFHKTEIIEILARLDGTEPKKYKKSLVEITQSLIEITSDEELIDFFTSQGQKMVENSSGSVTENTEEKEK